MKFLIKSLAVATISILGCLQTALAEEAKTESLTDKAVKHEKLGVKIESANHLFAEKYPLQYDS
ncbi:TPA: ammonia-forming cytochrome c nitrite reductase subunit c552, partial [Mannheimia haemolytica]|nr:ammonia-forming cytochrome c nitrite reductase subunit c552 [Mannheimia haemolytica]